MTTKWKSGNPTELGWYDTFHGKTYWTGKRWATKKHGKTVHVWGWNPIPIKLTPWFSDMEKPVRIGEYLFKYNPTRQHPEEYQFRAFWSGERWHIRDKNYAWHWNEPVAMAGQWRGILK